jgi:general secretion pathway protein E
VDPYDLAAALNGVVAQRLLRRVCPHCAEDDQPTPEMLQASGLPKAVLEEGWTFRRGRGCDDCRGSGYLGRQAIAQTLTLDPELRGLIAERASPAMQRAAAERRGLITLRDAALELVCAGITTLEEANRVTAVQE